MTVESLRRASTETTPGSLHVPALARRTHALLELDPVLDELERRAAVGQPAILSRSLLRALRELPVDVPVPLRDLPGSLIAALKVAPHGAVDIGSAVATRRAVPAVRVASAGVCSSSWSDGLRQASQFASYCARFAVMTSPRFDRDRAAMEARFYGIGLATMFDSSESFEWLVEPEPFRAKRETVSSWHFSESALEALAHNPDLVV